MIFGNNKKIRTPRSSESSTLNVLLKAHLKRSELQTVHFNASGYTVLTPMVTSNVTVFLPLAHILIFSSSINKNRYPRKRFKNGEEKKSQDRPQTDCNPFCFLRGYRGQVGTAPISDMTESLYLLHMRCWGRKRGHRTQIPKPFLFGERVGSGIMAITLEQLWKGWGQDCVCGPRTWGLRVLWTVSSSREETWGAWSQKGNKKPSQKPEPDLRVVSCGKSIPCVTARL